MKKTILLLAVSCWLLAVGSQVNAQSKLDTPLMGWSSWNTFGLEITDSLICQQADAMVNTGLSDAGYKYINIDDGYFGLRDSVTGHLLIQPHKFPNGVKWVADYIHSKGLKAGIYSDAGDNTCGSGNGRGDKWGMGVGLYGHEQEDLDYFFKEMDFDFIKVDYCGGMHVRLDEQQQYTLISEAIKKTGKKGARMNVCRWAYPGTWISSVAESWRTTGDINCSWRSVRSIVAENLYLSAYSSKGHYNDMDMLEVGRGLSEIEDQTHFGLWCIMNSPLLVGCDMRNIKPAPLALMKNPELIALNQDVLGKQAYVVKKTEGCFILVRDIEKAYGTVRAFAVYNPTDEAHTVNVSLSDLELGGKYKMRELISRQDVTDGSLMITVPAHGTKIYRIKAAQRLERRVYEAETGFIEAYQELRNNQQAKTGIYSYDDNCSGGLKATWLGMSDRNSLQWKNVYSRKGGEYTITVVEADGEQNGLRHYHVEVNGKDLGGFTSVDNTVNVRLKKGENTIRLFNTTDWMPNIDYITVEKDK